MDRRYLAAGVAAGLAAVWVAYSGMWLWVVGALILAVWLGIAGAVFVAIKAQGRSLEKAGQSTLHLFPLIPVGLFVFGGVLSGGPYGGLAGQLLAAAQGDRTGVVVVAGKAALIIPAAYTAFWTISKGSRL